MYIYKCIFHCPSGIVAINGNIVVVVVAVVALFEMFIYIYTLYIHHLCNEFH